MTRQDAIDILVGVITTNSEEENEALDMAIKALRQEPNEDLISRQVAIDVLETVGYDFSDAELSEIELEEVCEAVGDVRQDMINRIKRMPSADRPKWTPVSWHDITEEERAENGYPKDWDVYLDCEMPADEEEILITTRYGTVEKDVCYVDGEFSLDSGYDWIDDVVAWMPSPEPYEEETE